jgi:hypothetical protein
MPKPVLRAGQCLLIAAMFAASGGHWLVLQSVAWGGMIADYARTANLTVAVEKTFDGQHPCGLCKKIEKGRGNEKKRDAQLVVSKHELFYSAPPGFLLSIDSWWLQTTTNGVAELRTDQPSVPPPRS